MKERKKKFFYESKIFKTPLSYSLLVPMCCFNFGESILFFFLIYAIRELIYMIQIIIKKKNLEGLTI